METNALPERFEEVLSIAQRLAAPETSLNQPFLVLRNEDQLESLENLQANPSRKRGQVSVRDVPSFALYIKRHEEPGTAIFADKVSQQVVARLNFHEPGKGTAGWGDHAITLVCAKSREWKEWSGKHKQWLGQVDFADFLEDHVPDIAEPHGATLLDVAKTLAAKKNVNWKGGINTDNGTVQFIFEESMTTKAGQKGDLEVPTKLTLGIPVFDGGGNYKVNARLRFRIDDKESVQFMVILENPDKILESVFEAVVKDVAELTGYSIYRGTAS